MPNNLAEQEETLVRGEAASEPKGNNWANFKDVYLKVKAIIWP